MIKLSKRLMAIAELVHENDKVVDIGCDHALLDIYLAKKYPHMTLIASDINKNALSNAINNIKKYNLESRISCIVSNGLDNIDLSKINTVIISGMGTSNINSILKKDKLSGIDTIIIQSNNNLDKLREYVTSIGYYISYENIIKDNDKYYIIIKFIRGYKKYKYYEYCYGPILLNSSSNIYKEYLLMLYNKKIDIYKRVPKRSVWHRYRLLKDIRFIKRYLKNNKIQQ